MIMVLLFCWISYFHYVMIDNYHHYYCCINMLIFRGAPPFPIGMSAWPAVFLHLHLKMKNY